MTFNNPFEDDVEFRLNKTFMDKLKYILGMLGGLSIGKERMKDFDPDSYDILMEETSDRISFDIIKSEEES